MTHMRAIAEISAATFVVEQERLLSVRAEMVEVRVVEALRQGLPGAQGPQGSQGPAGANGAPGAQGPEGAQGLQGPQGPAGADGAPGAQGPAGPQGPAGANGAPGAQGLQGPQGPAGADGAPGAQGPAGAQGPQGPQGPAGANGAPGAQGPAGSDGAPGAQGAAGADGAPGPAGVDGTDGREIQLQASATHLQQRYVGDPGWNDLIGLDAIADKLDRLSLYDRHVGVWIPPGNGTSIGSVIGMGTPSATGTATTRNVATTRAFTRMVRLGYVSAAAAGSLSGARIAVANIGMGAAGSPALGGFKLLIVFGCSDASVVAGARQFVGVSSSTVAPTNVEPSTLTNSIGVGHGAADSNLKLYYGGSAAQTPIDLGANFPANTLSVDAYALTLECAAGVNNQVNWSIERLNTGVIASGTLNAATPGVQLPAGTTWLTPLQGWRSNNATALPVGLDFMRLVFRRNDF